MVRRLLNEMTHSGANAQAPWRKSSERSALYCLTKYNIYIVHSTFRNPNNTMYVRTERTCFALFFVGARRVIFHRHYNYVYYYS